MGREGKGGRGGGGRWKGREMEGEGDGRGGRWKGREWEGGRKGEKGDELFQLCSVTEVHVYGMYFLSTI